METSSATGLLRHIVARLSVAALVALVAVDLALVVASVGHLLTADGPADRGGPWVLETDRGFAEQWGYLQQATIAFLLVVLALYSRRWVFLPWAAVFAAALADDSLRLHENRGAWLADRLGERLWFPDGLLGLRANDLGEILVWGLLAVVPVVAAALLHRRSDAATRRASLGVAALLAGYVLFGGLVDQLHVLVMHTAIGDAVGTVEDGGELVVLSLTVAYALGLLAAARRRPGTPDEDDTPAVPSLATGTGAPTAS
ncbi:hypothetical protein [Geodermatophilus sp. SYSU D00710]